MSEFTTREQPIDLAGMLQEFHDTYGLPACTVPTANPEEAEFRYDLLAEEFREYREALDTNDFVETLDALGDILYVLVGSIVNTYGVSLFDLMTEIHRSNMTKLDADGNVLKNAEGKVIKGPNFSPLDLAPILGLT